MLHPIQFSERSGYHLLVPLSRREITNLDQLGASASVDRWVSTGSHALDTNSDWTLLDMAAISSRAAMLRLPGEAELGAQDRDHHEAAACPQYAPRKYKAQAAVIPLGWPGNGHGKT